MRTIQILFRLRQTALIAALVAIASTSYAQKKDSPKPDEMVLSTYEVGDLVVTVPDYALEAGRGAGATQGGGYSGGRGMFGGGGGGMGGGGMVGGAEQPAQAPGPSSITADSLLETIFELVVPDTWPVSGGEGRATVLGTTLVVRQTRAVHGAISQLLEDLRNGSATRRTVAIDARWLLLDSDDLEKLVVVGEDGQPKVNRQVLGELTRRPTSLRGLTSCFSGQAVYLTSGTVRSNVSGYIPVVGSVEPPKPKIMFASDRSDAPIVLTQLGLGGGEGGGRSVGYQPVITTNNFGVQIELRPTLLQADNAAVVDLKSTITFPGSPSNLEPLDAPTNALAPQVDRLAIQTQELATTLRVPLGEPVLVGGMTYMAPGPGEGGSAVDVQVQDVSAEQPQMYLVLELR